MNTTSLPDTITIFRPYGIGDGRVLVPELQREIEQSAPPPDSVMDRQASMIRDLGRAFRSVYINQAEVPVVPEALDLAIEEATSTTIHSYLGEDACVQTEIVPTFYRYVVSFFRSLVEFGADAVAGVYLNRSDDETLS